MNGAWVLHWKPCKKFGFPFFFWRRDCYPPYPCRRRPLGEDIGGSYSEKPCEKPCLMAHKAAPRPRPSFRGWLHAAPVSRWSLFGYEQGRSGCLIWLAGHRNASGPAVNDLLCTGVTCNATDKSQLFECVALLVSFCLLGAKGVIYLISLL